MANEKKEKFASNGNKDYLRNVAVVLIGFHNIERKRKLFLA